VCRPLLKEGKSLDDFRKGESWHEPVLDEQGRLTPFCRHKKPPHNLYLRFLHLNTIGHPTYTTESGQILTLEQVQPFLPKRENAYGNQGLDKPLRFLVYSLDNIEEIHVNGQQLIFC